MDADTSKRFVKAILHKPEIEIPAGKRKNVWVDPSLWARGRGPRALYGDERFAVSCLATAFHYDQSLAAACMLTYLEAANWDEQPEGIDQICDLLARVGDRQAVADHEGHPIRIVVATEVEVFEPAKDALYREEAWCIGRVDVSLTIEDGRPNQPLFPQGPGFPPRAHLLLETKLRGDLHKIEVRGRPLLQPAAYAAAWELLTFESDATVRAVGTIGVEDNTTWMGELVRWRHETGTGASVGACDVVQLWPDLLSSLKDDAMVADERALAAHVFLETVVDTG